MSTQAKKADVEILWTKEEIAAEAAFEKAKAHRDEVRFGRRAEIVKQIKALVKAYDLDAKSIFGGSVASEPKAQATIKYFDPATGKGWSGKGKAPQPFAAVRKDPAKLAAFLIDAKKNNR